MLAVNIFRFFRRIFVVRRPMIFQLVVTNIVIRSVPCLFISWKTRNGYWLRYAEGRRVSINNEGLLIIQIPVATGKMDISISNSWFSVKRTIPLKIVDIDADSTAFLFTDLKHPVYPSSVTGGRLMKSNHIKPIQTGFCTARLKPRIQVAPPRVQLNTPSFTTGALSLKNHSYPA